MGSLHWLTENWFTLLNAVGVIGSLLFTGYSLRSEAETRRIANLIALTESHRDIWKELFRQPRIGRVLDPSADVTRQPVTQEEEIFVNLIIQHLSVVLEAMQDDLTIKPEGLRCDVAWFFSLPVPAGVWAKAAQLQNRDFVEFVWSCLKAGSQSFQS